MNRQDVQDWLDKWPRDEMPVEVRRDGCGNVCLVVRDNMTLFDTGPSCTYGEYEIIIGAYPDKVEV